jgi:uncharacterized Zn-finger protein
VPSEVPDQNTTSSKPEGEAEITASIGSKRPRRHNFDPEALDYDQLSPGGKRITIQAPRAKFDNEEEKSSDEDAEGSNEGSIYLCPYRGCKKSFSRRMRLDSHMHMHYGTQPFQCEFPGCNKAFSEKQNLRIHMRIHRDERPFSCPLGCGKAFRTKGNM